MGFLVAGAPCQAPICSQIWKILPDEAACGGGSFIQCALNSGHGMKRIQFDAKPSTAPVLGKLSLMLLLSLLTKCLHPSRSRNRLEVVLSCDQSQKSHVFAKMSLVLHVVAHHATIQAENPGSFDDRRHPIYAGLWTWSSRGTKQAR